MAAAYDYRLFTAKKHLKNEWTLFFSGTVLLFSLDFSDFFVDVGEGQSYIYKVVGHPKDFEDFEVGKVAEKTSAPLKSNGI